MSGPRLPEGNYTARANPAAQFGHTSKGNEQIAVEFAITTPEFKGERITWFGYFTDKTSARTLESLRHCGWKGDDITDLDGLDANEVELVVAHEGYEGKVNARVQWVNRIGSGMTMKAPMNEAQKRAFAAKMKSAAAASRVNGSAPATKPAAVEADDSDIPF